MKRKPAVYLLFLLIFFCCIFYLLLQHQTKNGLSWQFAIKDKVGNQSILNVGKNLSFDERNVYFSDGKGLIHALDKNSGQIQWLRQLGNHSPFQINQDKNSLYISSFDSHIYSLDKKNGYINWSFSIPNQYWPDTEIVSDDNDQYLFFADRGGFLYAISKNTGREVWKKEFEAIDSKKIFSEKTIHFGFIKQNDDQLIVDHFPSKTIYTINKIDGKIIEKKISSLEVNLVQGSSKFDFGKFDLLIEQNIISQLIINCYDKNHNLLWSYRTERRINKDEIYQNGNRLYYLDKDNLILESIKIYDKPPNEKNNRKINFRVNEDFTTHLANENANPQIKIEFKKQNIAFFVKKEVDAIKYLLKNLRQIFNFKIIGEEKDNFFEFNILHQQNFYQNVFTNIKIEATFTNKSGEKISINGFYYDFNLWKIRAKLANGEWQWKIKIKTPFFVKTQNGNTLITKISQEDSLKIKDDVFVKNGGNEVFFPIGVQDIVIDQNKDGNPLDQIGFAKDQVPSNNSSQYNFLPFGDFIKLYKDEAGINISRYGPDNWAPAIWKNLKDKNSFSMDVSGNIVADTVFSEFKNKDLKTMMSIFSFYPPYTSKESISNKNNQKVLKLYLDYIVARYAAYVDIWELTNEAMPSLEWQNFISNYLTKIDPYNHPITTNLENTQLKSSDLLSIHAYINKTKDNNEIVNFISSLQKNQDWQKASIVSELGFKGSNYFENSGELLRKISWALVFQKKGIIFWNIGDGIYENEETACAYVGPKERSYLKMLNNFLPKMEAPLTNSFKKDDEENIAIYRLSDRNYNLFYLINLDQNKYKLHTVDIKVESKSKLEFMEPSSGKLLGQKEINQDINKISVPYFRDDLAIRISKIE